MGVEGFRGQIRKVYRVFKVTADERVHSHNHAMGDRRIFCGGGGAAFHQSGSLSEDYALGAALAS